MKKLPAEFMYYFFNYLQSIDSWCREEQIQNEIFNKARQFKKQGPEDIHKLIVDAEFVGTNKLILNTFIGWGSMRIVPFKDTDLENIFLNYCGIIEYRSLDEFKNVKLMVYNKTRKVAFTTNICADQNVHLVKYVFMVINSGSNTTIHHKYDNFNTEDFNPTKFSIKHCNCLVYMDLLVMGDLSKLHQAKQTFPKSQDYNIIYQTDEYLRGLLDPDTYPYFLQETNHLL